MTKDKASSRVITKKQIALLHVAKRDLGLDDDTYRAILVRFGHCDSAADLDPSGFNMVIRYFTAMGFRSTWTSRTFGDRPGMASPAQVDLIRSLWRKFSGDEDPKETALNNWLKKYHHVSALRFVDGQKAAKIIPALRAMNNRRQVQN